MYSVGVGKMASLLLGRKQKSYFSKYHNRDRFSELLIEEEETPFFTDCSEVPPHRRHMKKQVSFDSPPCAMKKITNNGIEETPSEDVPLRCHWLPRYTTFQSYIVRSYQRDLLEFYKEQAARGARGSVPDVPIIPTLEVMPPKPGSSRLSRKDKQGGWSLPRKEKIFLSKSSLKTILFIDEKPQPNSSGDGKISIQLDEVYYISKKFGFCKIYF